MSETTKQTAPTKRYQRPYFLRASHATVDFLFIVLMLVLLLISIYIKMDSDSVYDAADAKHWVQYKPDFPEDVLSFEELQQRNPDVIGWLTIYGTNIDYPLLYSEEDNNYYLFHNPEGRPESSGSLYIDTRCSSDFSDFNTIIHGHHMAREKMFGDLDKFMDQEYFNKHEYGNVFFNGEDHGIQIIAAVLADGYDAKLYRAGIQGSDKQLAYLEYIYHQAKLIRGVNLTGVGGVKKDVNPLTLGFTSPITPKDKIILMSTCNLTDTNGRYVVVAKILDHPVESPYPEKIHKNPDSRLDTFTLFNQYGSLPLWIWIAIIVLLVILTYILYKISRRRDRKVTEKKASIPEGDDAYDQKN